MSTVDGTSNIESMEPLSKKAKTHNLEAFSSVDCVQEREVER